jgi:uncharacterized phage protein gp47/JayE
MPLTLTELQEPVTRESVRETLLALLTQLGFPATAWQDESAARTFVEAQAWLTAEVTNSIALLARQGFLETAEEDFLSALVKSHYDEDRFPAVNTQLPVTLNNAGSNTYPINVGDVVVRANNGRTFTNIQGGTLSAGTLLTLEFLADESGADSNISSQTLELVTPFAGVIATSTGLYTVVGSDAEGDVQLRERARSKWGSLRINRVRDGVLNLARQAVPGIHGVSIDDDNPRGPGTVDVYLSGQNASAGSGDIATVQAALDAAFFGNADTGATGPDGPTPDKLVGARAAPTLVQNVTANVFVRGVVPDVAYNAIYDTLVDFIESIPVGGFDFSPGPINVLQAGQIITTIANIPGVVSVQLVTPSSDITIPEHTKVLVGDLSLGITLLNS